MLPCRANSTSPRTPKGLDGPCFIFPFSLTISLIGLFFSFIAYFPGGMGYDPFVMWGMGWKWAWHDWHATYISLLMAVARLFRDDPAIYLFFQLSLHWGGLYFFSAALRKQVGNWAVLIPLLGFSPMFLGLSGYLHKTPLQTAIFLFIFGFTYLHYTWKKPIPLLGVITLLLLFFVGIPLRRFGHLTAIPLLLFFLHTLSNNGSRRQLVKYLIAAFVISVTSLLINKFVTYNILDAEKRIKIVTLYTYDLAAIYALTGINYVPDPDLLTHKKYLHINNVRRDYIKYDGLWQIMKIYKTHRLDREPAVANTYKEAWWKAVRAHPSTWLRHKVHAFKRSLGYQAQMLGYRGAWTYKSRKNVFGLQKSQNPLYRLTHQYMTTVKNCLCLKPWAWLLTTYGVLLLTIIAWLRHAPLRQPLIPHLTLLTSAGLFYPVYFLISLDKDLRFTYWAITATALAVMGVILTLLSCWREKHLNPVPP